MGVTRSPHTAGRDRPSAHGGPAGRQRNGLQDPDRDLPWRDLPERYGSWQTVYTRFRRYALDGVFTRALHAHAAGLSTAYPAVLRPLRTRGLRRRWTAPARPGRRSPWS
ncbi:transposase [Streptomyces sparsogenes]|uniref:transposase n=1 Tax=Streptomyces sparsogenes TaxID=67365 RepID=UPI0033D2EAFA